MSVFGECASSVCTLGKRVMKLGLFVALMVGLTNQAFATYYYSSYGSAGNRVWIDENQNGLQDSGEQGAANVYLLIGECRYGGRYLKWTKTDSNGYYKFSKLRHGYYKILAFPEFHNPPFEGAQFSPADVGSKEWKDSDAKYFYTGYAKYGIIGQTDCFKVYRGQYNKKIDFGIYVPKTNLLPDAVDDFYEVPVNQPFEAHVVFENDDQGDGCAAVTQVDGSLPDGVELQDDGTLIGTPTASGIYEFSYRLTDCDGDTDEAHVTIVVTEQVAYCAASADGDQLHPNSGGHSFWIPGISKNLDFTADSLVTRILPNGDMTITGTISDENNTFAVDLVYSGFMDDSASPKLELNSSAYVANGGPIDPSTWDFYTTVSGTLTGIAGDWQGAVLDAALTGPKAQIGVGANGKNGNFGFSNWFDFTVSSASTTLPAGVHVGQSYYGDINVDFRHPDDCVEPEVIEFCAVTAETGPFNKWAGGHAFYIPKISKDLEFEGQGLVTQELPNGELKITGTISNGVEYFEVDLTYSGLVEDSPNAKLELLPGAYVDNGGPIDPDDWKFYTDVTGTLTGIQGQWDGVTLDAELRVAYAQIGDGANGKNLNYGFSNWFTFTIASADNGLPSGFHLGDELVGDINVDFVDCPTEEITYCPVSAESGDFNQFPGGNSLLIDGVFGNLDFIGDRTLVRTLPDGDMTLTGQVSDGANVFDVDLVYTGFQDASPNPVLALLPAAYVDNGGPIDPSSWDFFTGLSGTVTGVSGAWEGVVLDVTPKGEPAQIGVGANGKNTKFGLSGWLTMTVASAANGLPAGLNIGDSFGGDINVDLEDSCPDPQPEIDAIDDVYVAPLRFAFTANVLDNDIDIVAPATVVLESGSLPPGLTLAADGTLSGLPAMPGEFQFVYRVTDSNGSTDTATVTVNVTVGGAGG